MVVYQEPGTLGEAAALARAHPDAMFLSGGTAVVLMLKQRLINPATLISLRGLTDVPGWRQITLTDTWLRIGAGVSLSAVAGSDLVRRSASSLAEAAGVVGNVRIRNAATMGGNIAEADYASDPPAALVNLDAEIEVRSDVASRTVPASEMFTDFYATDLREGEIVTGVRIPVSDPPPRQSYLKFRSRSAEDRPCVGVAVSLRLSGDAEAQPGPARAGAVESLRVVIGAVAGTPQRWPEITEPVVGRVLDHRLAQQVAQQHADAVDPISDVRGSEWYRREMVRVLVRRCLESLAGSGEASGDG
ncbi:MAG: FAD binding domain-containing protein [Micromonosporaceae bacterium]